MNNVLLGKTLKAMYKLSGKTLTQISDETFLSVDTINNLFYARIQKPGIGDIQTLVKAMGGSMHSLLEFMESHTDVDNASNITELYAQYVTSAESEIDSEMSKEKIPENKGIADNSDKTDQQLYFNYSEQIKAQYEMQIQQMNENRQNLELHFSNSLSDLKERHMNELRMQEDHIRHLKKLLRIIGIALALETAMFVMFTVFDVLNRNIGFFR